MKHCENEEMLNWFNYYLDSNLNKKRVAKQKHN